MTDKERDELKEVIRKDYPGISEAEREMPEDPKAEKNLRPTGWWTQANHRRLTSYTLPSNNVLSRCSDG